MKNSKLIIGLLLGIIIMIVAFIILFTTNTISITSNNNTKNTNTKEKTDEQSTTNEDNTKSDEEKYSKIIGEYRNAMNDNEFNNSTNIEEKYPNINDNMMHFYHTDKSPTFNYVYYDINNDNNNELIVGNEKSIYEIYTYDGNKPIRFFNESCLGERCNAKIYDNGLIYFYGAGGASIHGLDFFKIASDGYSKETFKSYSVEYDENKNVTITDNITKSKTNYTNDEEVISSLIDNAKEVDLTKLNWNEIK